MPAANGYDNVPKASAINLKVTDNISTQLRSTGIEASVAKLYPKYAPDYWATYFTDPDGIRLEVTNYRLERRERHDNW